MIGSANRRARGSCGVLATAVGLVFDGEANASEEEAWRWLLTWFAARTNSTVLSMGVVHERAVANQRAARTRHNTEERPRDSSPCA
ncbi:hypothetical protein CIC12_05260 [Burkholderia sp. SG-MS1]|nr:hypothetical protein [Paraburkholderia sp. SG-MS1]